MTQDEVIEMARQVASHGVEDHRSGEVSYVFYNEHLMNFAKLVAQHERSWEKFCDSNCVWTDHHPDCKLAKDEPVAWVGLNLDNMAEAFHRVIEEHHSRKNPFHDPVNGDAMIALRELRGLIAYMKRNTTPPQRKPLTEKELNVLGTQWHFNLLETKDKTELFAFARAIEAAHGIKGEA